MSAKAGDRIEIESETVGTPAREGEIVEVIQGQVSVRYRVRWRDGHESVMAPSGGTARIVPKRSPKRPTRKPTKKR